MEPARARRQRWGRRRTVGVTILGVVAVSGLFVVSDGPRQTGLTDALGLTCGEYVHFGVLEPTEEDQIWRGSGHPQDVFGDWETFVDSLRSADAEQVGHEADAAETLLEDLSAIADAHDAEPTQGAFGGWSDPRAEFSAAPAGDAILVGEHLEEWLTTDRVSVVDPGSGDITVSAAVEHPDREAHEDRQPVLRGVGVSEGSLVLQTPTVRGDTDVVIVDPGSEEEPQCIRLEGAFQPSRFQADYPNAWHSVMNLNGVAGREADQFQIVHGRDLSTPGSRHSISSVDIASGEVQPFPGGLDLQEQEFDVALSGFEVRSFTEVGGDHLFLDWDYGYVIFQRR